MGLLDDAIREHLDLKRRRGADPTEVEREEREVLGPVRRRGEPGPDDEPALALAREDDLEHEPLPHPDEEWDDWEDEPAAEAEPRSAAGAGTAAGAFDHERIAPLEPDRYQEDAGPSRYEEAERELYAAQGPEQRYAPPPEREPFVAPEPDRYAAPPERSAGPPAAAERGAEPVRADHGYEPPVEEQTTEFNVEESIHDEGHPPAKRDEDVLEETPDFLQDTPDHDRLWFEQRPPRDFDFDG